LGQFWGGLLVVHANLLAGLTNLATSTFTNLRPLSITLIRAAGGIQTKFLLNVLTSFDNNVGENITRFEYLLAKSCYGPTYSVGFTRRTLLNSCYNFSSFLIYFKRRGCEWRPLWWHHKSKKRFFRLNSTTTFQVSVGHKKRETKWKRSAWFKWIICCVELVWSWKKRNEFISLQLILKFWFFWYIFHLKRG